MGRAAVVLASSLVAGFLMQAQPRPQTDKARELLSHPPKDTVVLRRQLVALGDAAVGPVVEAITDQSASFVRLAFLITTLGEIKSDNARRALAERLRDDRPFVRGYTATVLGQARVRCAIPALITLVEDRSEYIRIVSTDPAREAPQSVGAIAIKALEQLTGLKPSDRSLGAEFQQYWSHNRDRFDCAGWN